jgi:proline dehydrogenase
MRSLLLFLAKRENFKNVILRYKIFRDTVWRFVAGETLQDAMRAVREANSQGIRGTLDLLGENTSSREDARNATREVLDMLDTIKAEGADCNVSVKLTQLGLDLDSEFCYSNLREIVAHAGGLGNFVRVDMEGSAYTQRTLDMVLRLRKEFENIGAVIQAYLYRSEKDVQTLLAARTRIRLCKGAYLEPESVAFKKKADTDANFVRLMKILLDSGIYHGIATHDVAMIAATKAYAAEQGIPQSRFEFQMLYGVRRDLQLVLTREGYNMRVYIPYGRAWYPYFMRRLAERPANLFFILRNLFRD